jgi:AraC family transcriptional regulator
VNRVLDHIATHLDGDLSLAKLSSIAYFSPFHFHRIFQSVTGETLNSHVRRVRLERAALLLKTSPAKRITDAALEAGFAGTAEFSRAFKNRFGRTASSWDRRSPLEKSKICKEPDGLSLYTLEELERWKAAANLPVQVRRFDAFRYVYTRTFDPYGNAKLVDDYHTVRAWLAGRGTEVCDVVFIGMSLDDPSITPSEKCRYDIGVAFQKSYPDAVPGFSIRDFAPMRIASVHCIGDLGWVDRAWQYLYRIWLPSTTFEPADMPAMEMFMKLPEEIGWDTFDLQACIPLVEL